MHITSIGIDLGKTTFHLVALGERNKVLIRKKFSRHRLAQRAPRNKVVVAIANKLARMAWAVLSSGKDYRHQSLQPVAA
jgi:hypothetical protein